MIVTAAEIERAKQKKEEGNALKKEAQRQADLTGEPVTIKDGRIVKNDKMIQREANKNIANDMTKGKEFANELLGEDFALSRLGDQSEVQGLREGLNANANMSEAERIARQESAYNTLNSSEGTQNRQLLKQLSAAGVRGGAAGGAISDLASTQASGRRQMAQNLYLQEQEMGRQGLRDLAQFELGVQKFDIGQEQAEISTRLNTQLAGTSLYSQERSSIRQDEAALAAAEAAGGGKK
jgi:hypothetical protein